LKVPILGKLPPVKFLLEYFDDEYDKAAQDLKIYISRRTKQPMDGNFEKMFMKPKAATFIIQD